MKRPFVYHGYEETKKPGYLARRMAMYRKQIDDEKKRQAAIDAEAQAKVRTIGRDPK